MVEYTPENGVKKSTPDKVWKRAHHEKRNKRKKNHTKECVEKSTPENGAEKKRRKMNKVELGERIAKVRQHFGLSQAQFAQKVNRSPGLFSKVEKGRSDISEETINVIVEVYGVNKEWLLTGEGDMGCGDAADKAGIDKRIKEIRKEARQTQEEFGKKIGYSKRQVYCVESGKVNPSRQYLRKIATTFSVNFDWLLTGKGEKEMKEVEVSEELISWLRKNPDVVEELEIRSGVKGTPTEGVEKRIKEKK